MTYWYPIIDTGKNSCASLFPKLRNCLFCFSFHRDIFSRVHTPGPYNAHGRRKGTPYLDGGEINHQGDCFVFFPPAHVFSLDRFFIHVWKTFPVRLLPLPAAEFPEFPRNSQRHPCAADSDTPARHAEYRGKAGVTDRALRPFRQGTNFLGHDNGRQFHLHRKTESIRQTARPRPADRKQSFQLQRRQNFSSRRRTSCPIPSCLLRDCMLSGQSR